MKRLLLALFTLAATATLALSAHARETPVVRVDVPIRCGPPQESGPTSLAMVLGRYGADSLAMNRTREAIVVPSLGATIESLMAVATRLGYSARIAQPGLDSLLILLSQGIPPILCLEPGPGSRGRERFFVVFGAEKSGRRYHLLDGARMAKPVHVELLARLWNPATGRALIVSAKPQ